VNPSPPIARSATLPAASTAPRLAVTTNGGAPPIATGHHDPTRPAASSRADAPLPFFVARPARLIVLLASALAPVVFAQQRFDWTHRLLAAALGLFAYLIADYDWRSSRARGVAPLLAVSALTYYVYFGLAMIWEGTLRPLRGTFKAEPETILAAQVAVLVSLVTYAAAYRWFLGRGSRLAAPLTRTLPAPTAVTGLLPWAVLWAAVALVVRLASAIAPGAIPQAVAASVGALFSTPFVVGLLAWVDHHRSTPATRFLLFGITALLSVAGLLSGMLAETLIPLATLAASRLLLTGRFPWLLVAAGLVLFIVLQPAKFAYRQETFADEQGRRSDVTVQDRMSVWWDALVRTWSGHGEDNPEITDSMSRVAELLPVTQAIEWVPDRVPYAGARHWLDALVMWIPRVAWPEKPVQELWREYGITFNRQTELGARTTAVGVPQVAEGYWSMGWIGVLLAALVSGGLLGLSAGMLPLAGWPQFAIVATFLVSFWAYSPAPLNLAGFPLKLGAPWLAAWFVAVGRLIVAGARSRATERPDN